MSRHDPSAPEDYSRRGEAALADQATLDESVRWFGLAVRHTTDGDPGLAGRLLDLGVAVDRRWKRDGVQSDLDDAIDLYRRAAAAAEPDLVGACLVNLCHALRVRYSVTGSREDLDAAVEAGEACIRATVTVGDRRADRLEQIAHAYRERYELSGDLVDLDSAVSRYREASPHVAPGGLVGRALVHARNYALATRTYAEVAGGAGRLAEAIEASLRLVGDPAAAGNVQWAARQLLETAVDVTDLDRPVAVLRHVADLLTGSDQISIRMDLVAALQRRTELTGGTEEAEAAVAEAHRVFDAAATGGTGEDRRHALSTLGGTQLSRYECTGLLAHLDEAITSLRDVAAWAVSPAPVALTNLAHALVIRYEQLAEPQDLDQAIALSKRVLALAGLDAKVRSSVASSLGRALWMRYLRTGKLRDIDDAIDAVGVAMRAASAAPRYAAIAAANLGTLRLDRYRRTRRPEDLAEAVRLARAGLKAMTDGSIAAERVPGQMVNLALALDETYRSGGEAALLDEAIDLATRAAPLLGGVERHRRGVAGTLLTDRFRRDGDTADARAALDYLRTSAETATAPAIVRVDAAMVWGQLARDAGDATGSVTALTLALDLMPQVSWQGTTRRTRERALASVRGVASDAAAATLDIADPAAAVSCLERGRGVLWTQQLELRGGLDKLAVVAPTLAERVESVRQRLGGGPEEVEALELPPLVKDGTHVARW